MALTGTMIKQKRGVWKNQGMFEILFRKYKCGHNIKFIVNFYNTTAKYFEIHIPIVQ
jgi:hypothetical protein